MCKKRFPTLIVFSAALLCGSVTAQGADIAGVIPTTLTIFENSRLVGDVQCLQLDNGPCIEFGASGIKLELNGFTMTGPADPPANCVTPAVFLQADGIASNFQHDIVIEGPGLVQKFRRHGIFLNQTTKAIVKKAVSHHNCFSGLQLAFVTETLVEEFVSVRNAVASAQNACGGVCIFQSHNNRVRRSELSGNGSVAIGAPGVPNDFGVGLLTNSSGNVIEENGITGNINGVWLAPTVGAGNVIRKNVIVGNPPAQISATFGVVGADIRDFSPPGTNRFEENLCITYLGTNPPPCPNLPQFAGHQNN